MFRNMILAKTVLLYPYNPKFKNALTRKLRNVNRYQFIGFWLNVK